MFSSRKSMRRSGIPPSQNYYQQPSYDQYPQAFGSYYQNQNQNMQMPYQQPYNQNVPYPTPYSSPYPTPYSASYPTPYPTQQQQPFPQQSPSGVQSIMGQFKNKDGTYNVDKMMNTAGQMMGAVNQIGSMVSGLSKTFKI
ncbi:YppG family protein [Cytobacillus sp. S13-E01]|uniref:YppG family protein n=1 Tax=Cytobacillus sp. S13-E01 TaxID=3031326 RepID=UPI0023D7E48B|nr:YppG family protein [Cytobacillus sp. S13-E01]MDF0726273.1 YppG family protein [Cytobacillus sp. S13-E01]